VIKESKGVKFGFLAYTYSNEGGKDGNGQAYGTDHMDKERMRMEVSELKKEADIVVVSMHAGTEYAIAASAAQTSFARAAVDAGAALVIGHHPHSVQTAEKYGDGYIIYSLGNFVFDQMWSEDTRLGAVAEVNIKDKKITAIDFVPVKIYDYAQPRLAEGADKEKILERLKLGGD
jgi:poly-gamma-glutamate synthesis protein (capsule biosynthesis protein)